MVEYTNKNIESIKEVKEEVHKKFFLKKHNDDNMLNDYSEC